MGLPQILGKSHVVAGFVASLGMRRNLYICMWHPRDSGTRTSGERSLAAILGDGLDSSIEKSKGKECQYTCLKNEN